MKPLLRIEGITYSYSDKNVLKDIFIEAEQNEVIGIIGRNGCGKTTLFNCMTIIPNIAGSIFMNGKYVERTMRKQLISYMTQISYLPKNLTVNQAVKKLVPTTDNQMEILEDERIQCVKEQRIVTLSGGERRYLEFLLVDHLRKSITILDEPFAELEPIYIERIIRRIERNKDKCCYLVSDQNYYAIKQVCTRIYLLSGSNCYPVNNEEDLVRMKYLVNETIN
jgi:ABC-type (unclassified) transport system, ATPase component